MTKMIKNYENVIDFSLLKQIVTNRFLFDLKDLFLFDFIDLTSRFDIDIYSNFLYLTFYYFFIISSMNQCFYKHFRFFEFLKIFIRFIIAFFIIERIRLTFEYVFAKLLKRLKFFANTYEYIICFMLTKF